MLQWPLRKNRPLKRLKGPVMLHPNRPLIPLFETLELRRLLSGGVWQINGDINKGHKSDVIIVAPSSTDSSILEATINGKVVSSRSAAKVKQININSGAGNDSVK